MFLIIYRGKKLSRTKPNASNHKTFNHIEDDDDDDNEDFGVLGSGGDSRAVAMGCGHGTLFFWCSDFFFFLNSYNVKGGFKLRLFFFIKKKKKP